MGCTLSNPKTCLQLKIKVPINKSNVTQINPQEKSSTRSRPPKNTNSYDKPPKPQLNLQFLPEEKILTVPKKLAYSIENQNNIYSYQTQFQNSTLASKRALIESDSSLMCIDPSNLLNVPYENRRKAAFAISQDKFTTFENLDPIIEKIPEKLLKSQKRSSIVDKRARRKGCGEYDLLFQALNAD